MTQNQHVNKTNVASATSLDRRDFLNALYTGSPHSLYLELRCIHPTTGEVRSLWGRMGNKRELSTALKQSQTLNDEGFGVYFAPCLRKGKHGKAEAAVLIPALWVDIDCDGDIHRRDQGLQKLLDFDPAPSLILDSGGGWHGYWLLDAPFPLQEDADRQLIASILRGLFTVLGGDPDYVKTVAGIMRLPDSVNTKPERGGAVVKIMEGDPERRYPLERFYWLESQPERKKTPTAAVGPAAENGHHPLPARTEAYLASGARDGNRNAELFAAACQLRDAGYSQSEAEQQLVARYVADGSRTETEGVREHEAQATITSAYSRAAREPIREANVATHEQINRLVSRYRRDVHEPQMPSAAQIREVIQSCVELDSLEWAEARKRLKPLCGDTFRIEDLNRMYQQARRERERTQQEIFPTTPQYVEANGSILFEKASERGTVRQTVAEWTGRVTEWITRVNDDGEGEHLMRLQLQHQHHTALIDIPAELFGDANGLQRFIAQKAGGIYATSAGMHRHLPSAILKLSGEIPKRQVYRFMGWTQTDGRWHYVSPSATVTPDGIVENSPEVELENRLRDYGLSEMDLSASIRAFKVAVAILPPTLAPTLVAFALLPVMQRFFPAAAPKPALHLVGTTGSGKSEIAATLCSFYGRFTRDAPPAQWGDTINTVEALGYPLADALYWVDDFKQIYADERTFTRFLQSYSRGMGRGRLTREAKLRQERPCRGLLLSTGETAIEGEASVLSRMPVLEVPPWEKRDPDGAALAALEAHRDYLPGFSVNFIRWLARQADAGTLMKELATRFETNTQGYQDKLRVKGVRQAHTGRMVQNWAVLVTVYQMLANFLREQDAADVLPSWQDALFETMKVVQQERAGDIFLNVLGQLIAGGRCVIEPSLRVQYDPTPGTIVVGYRDEQFTYLLPDVALREVNAIHPLHFSAYAIGTQLREDGRLIPGTTNLTVQRSVRGSVIRLWRLKWDSGDCEGCEPCEGD